jgi:hypothetical protein
MTPKSNENWLEIAKRGIFSGILTSVVGFQMPG